MQEKEFDMIRQIIFKMQIYGVESGIYIKINFEGGRLENEK